VGDDEPLEARQRGVAFEVASQRGPVAYHEQLHEP
jgi:hypothetical protein